ncbi:MAG: hypothetical protein H8K03_21625 [Nitrospira sp.]
MRVISKGLGIGLLSVLLLTSLSTVALSVDREVYDKPEVQTGKTIKGKVMKVDEEGSQAWQVSVKDGETGNVFVLHVDKTTTRKDNMMRPALGDNVIVKYNERGHAISFLTDQHMNR